MKAPEITLNLKSVVLTTIITFMFVACALGQPAPKNQPAADATLQRIEQLVSNTEQNLKYIPPASADLEGNLYANTEKELQEAIANLEELAEKTINDLKYVTPSEESSISSKRDKRTSMNHASYRPVKVEFSTSSTDAWLKNSGYYKTSRTPAWDKFRMKFNEKDTAGEVVEKLGH